MMPGPYDPQGLRLIQHAVSSRKVLDVMVRHVNAAVPPHQLKMLHAVAVLDGIAHQIDRGDVEVARVGRDHRARRIEHHHAGPQGPAQFCGDLLGGGLGLRRGALTWQRRR